ncbi:unnamed protein product [Mycena citricolor]|uniref:Uncharacterized protein n=1 Tax=Mycena citricolor TaxID=2018698 RepID=A0AAD2Q4G8_9AGAR|nr:unnamed protein product [Mycena citricolor]
MSSSQIPALTSNELEQLFVLISDAQLTNHLADRTRLEKSVEFVKYILHMGAFLTFPTIDSIKVEAHRDSILRSDRICVNHVLPDISTEQMADGNFRPNLLMMLRPPQSDKAQSVTSTTIVVSTDVILALRVWILFARPSRMIGFFVGLIVAEFAALLVVGVYTIRDLGVFIQIEWVAFSLARLMSERLTAFKSIAWMLYCHSPANARILCPPPLHRREFEPLLILGMHFTLCGKSSCMFAMTLYKCRDTAMSPGLIKTPVIQIFLRDGSYWFLAVLLLSLSELLIWHNARPSLAQIPIVPGTACIAIIGARVVLNIKNLARTNNGRDSSQTLTQTSVMWYHPRMPTRPKIETTPWYLRTN